MCRLDVLNHLVFYRMSAITEAFCLPVLQPMHRGGGPQVVMFSVLEFIETFITAMRTTGLADYTVPPRLHVTSAED